MKQMFLEMVLWEFFLQSQEIMLLQEEAVEDQRIMKNKEIIQDYSLEVSQVEKLMIKQGNNLENSENLKM